MEHRDPLWQAVFEELAFESDQELLNALRAHEIDEAVAAAVEDALRRERAGVPPAEWNQEAVVGAVGDAQTRLYAGVPAANRNRAVNKATNTMIDLPPGCFEFSVGANIVAVEVVSVVRTCVPADPRHRDEPHRSVPGSSSARRSSTRALTSSAAASRRAQRIPARWRSRGPMSGRSALTGIST